MQYIHKQINCSCSLCFFVFFLLFETQIMSFTLLLLHPDKTCPTVWSKFLFPELFSWLWNIFLFVNMFWILFRMVKLLVIFAFEMTCMYIVQCTCRASNLHKITIRIIATVFFTIANNPNMLNIMESWLKTLEPLI